MEQTARLTTFRDSVAALRRQWDEMAAQAEQIEDEETRAQRPNLGKLRKGLRTPESAFYQPVLEVLNEMGGSGKVAEVLERVEKRMRPVLKDVDYAPLASSPDNPRWRNTAQWARSTMTREGPLKGNSPRGVWEISNKGRAVLEQAARDNANSWAT